MLRLAALLALACAACADPKVSLSGGTREFVASDYPQILKRWTRSRSLITLSELDDLLTVTATFESWEFRWAYVIRYASDYRLTISQRGELLDRLRAEKSNPQAGFLWGGTLQGLQQAASEVGGVTRGAGRVRSSSGGTATVSNASRPNFSW